MIGTMVSGRYRVDAQLGEGGMGVVYRAQDTVLDRPVAIKTLSSQGLGADGLKRLLLEARAAAQLNHPNVVAIHDVLQEDGTPHIVMELVEGRTLRELIPQEWQAAVQLIRPVFQAIAAAHERGIIHRDLKPENIVVTNAGVPKIMDFGLARSEGRSRLTQAGMLVGTVAYMAPEQVLRGAGDARSDLYSLGCVLYETVTGRAPFTGDDPIAVISQHLQIPPVAPHWYRPEIPPELEGIILKLMAKDPAERYAAAADVVAALDQLTAAPMPASADAATISPALLLGTVLRTRLVGRDAELRELKSSIELVASGHGQVVLVEGEPGVGKTRLLQEAQVYARLRGFVALAGRCYEQESAVPYLPFIELFQIRFREMPRDSLTEELGQVAPEFVKIIPEVRERLHDVEPSVPLEPVQERLRLFSSIARYLTSLARRTPVVLVLEDLHWADAASLSLLQSLARTLRGERILLLGSYRDVEVDRRHPLGDVLREMNRERLYTLVNLRRLPPAGVGAMVQTMFEVPQVSDEFVGVLYEETEGNPFFVEEVLKSLVEEGAIYREEGRWQRKKIAEIQVPKSIREVIGRRLERVSDTCRQALSVGAVIGRRFRFETVQAVGGLGEDALLTALEEAVQAQIIREETQAGSVEYDFAHALIREVLYEGLSARRRMTFHQKVAEALEREYAARLDAVVEDLAHHFTEAPHGENLRKAIEYSIMAAAKAMRVFAYEEASGFYKNAADLLKELGDEARLAQVQQAGAEPFAHLDKPEAALEWYQGALSFYERTGQPIEAARVHRLMGRVLQRHRRYTAAVPHLELALQQLDAERHADDVVHAHLDIARALSFLGEFERAEHHAQTALQLATDRGWPAVQAEAHVSMGFVLFSRFDTDGAQRHNEEAIRLARAAGEREAGFTLFRALRNKGVVLANRGRRREALDLYLEELAVGERLRDVGLIAATSLNLVLAYWYGAGDGARARFHLRQALELPLSPEHRETAELWTHLLQGDWEGALAIREIAARKIHDTGEKQTIYADRMSTAGLLLDLGRDQDAYAEAREGAAMAEATPIFLVQYVGFIITLARALVRGGDSGRAERLIRLTEEAAERTGSTAARTSALIARGVLALEHHDPQAAVTMLDNAAVEEGLAWMNALRFRFHAEALARRNAPGDLERARQAWDACRALLERMEDQRRIELFREQLAPLLRI